jgi:hypothetical protein
MDRVWKRVVSLITGTILNVQKDEKINVRIYELSWALISWCSVDMQQPVISKDKRKHNSTQVRELYWSTSN